MKPDKVFYSTLQYDFALVFELLDQPCPMAEVIFEIAETKDDMIGCREIRMKSHWTLLSHLTAFLFFPFQVAYRDRLGS